MGKLQCLDDDFQPESIVCKSARNTASVLDSDLSCKFLLDEIKILMHLEHHAHIVSFVGACTRNCLSSRFVCCFSRAEIHICMSMINSIFSSIQMS